VWFGTDQRQRARIPTVAQLLHGSCAGQSSSDDDDPLHARTVIASGLGSDRMVDDAFPETVDVVVVGAGVVGLSCAWRLAGAGLTVAVVDPEPGSAASRMAAGMLAPVTEAHYGEDRLTALALAAAERYPSFVADVEDASGLTVGYRTEGTLSVAADEGDRAQLVELHAFRSGLGLDSVLLSRRECRELEPLLAPNVRGGLLAAGDRSVDNRRLVAALLVAAGRAGVRFVGQPVISVRTTGGRAVGVDTPTGGVAAGSVLLAAGCWSAAIDGVPAEARPPVRPVKGQILRLQAGGDVPAPMRSVRAVVCGSAVYVVPRADGEVVVGATMEEMGFDTTPRARGLHELLRDVYAVLPAIGEMAFVEFGAGLRPGSPDNAPILGPTASPGLFVATGHHRNGILLAPLTADVLTAAVLGTPVPEVARPFSPLRFASNGRVPERGYRR
jgi:glycine oxidase